MGQHIISAILIVYSHMFNDPRFKKRGLEAIKQAAPGVEVVSVENEEEWEQRSGELASRVEVVVGYRPGTWFKEMPNLRWMQQTSAGANWLLSHPEVAKSDVVLTNVAGVRDIPVAEHALALMLTLSRCIHHSVRRQLKHHWDKFVRREDMTELSGATMGLIGVGKIGEETAKRAKGMNMRVLGLRRRPELTSPHVDRMFGPQGLMELLCQSDWVVITGAMTSETIGLIGENELRTMKKSAYLINVARGPMIQEEALIKALQERWIAGAGLDVVEQEPLPQESPLWDMENVVITPHHAGASPYAVDRFIKIFTENLRRYQAGEPLMNVVDKRLGY